MRATIESEVSLCKMAASCGQSAGEARTFVSTDGESLAPMANALEEVPAGVDQSCDFFLAESAGQPLTLSWVRQKLAELVALERAHEEETQCGNLAYDCPDGKLPLLEQIGLIGAQMRQSKLVRRLAKVAGELIDRP